MSYKRSVAKTLFIVVVVFAVLRLPFTILQVLREKYYAEETSISSGMQLFWYISQYLLFLNAAVNPLIYGFNNENFRRAYYQISWVRRWREAGKMKKSPDSPHCCYCTFMKRGKPARKPEEELPPETVDEDVSKEITTEGPTAQSTERIREEPDDVLVTEVDADGFI